MKYLKLLIGLVALMSACSEHEVSEPEFNVVIDNKTYIEGDTVIFRFTGNPDNITVYTGDSTHQYMYRDRTALEEGVPQLQFSTWNRFPGQVNTLKLLVSSDFNGVTDTTNVKEATWTDITSRAILSTGADNTPSGIVDLSDFAGNDPVYLALRYLGYNDPALTMPYWAIRTFEISNIEAGVAYSIAKTNEIGWTAVDFKNLTVYWQVPATGRLIINPNLAAHTNDDNDDWVVSKPLNLKKVTPDVGVSIKNLISAKLDTYEYVFSKAGTYKVVFVAFNVSIDDRKEAVREVTVTINPK